MAEPGSKMRSLASQPLLFPHSRPLRGVGDADQVPSRGPCPSQPPERGAPAKASHWALFRARWAFALPQWAGAVQAVMWQQRR